MIPDPAEILRRRVTAATVVRLLVFAPVLIAVSIGVAWLTHTLDSRLHTTEHVAYACAVSVFLAMAVIMWVIAPWHARHAVRVPKKFECPGCRYRLEGLTEARCSECGMLLTSEFVAQPGERTPRPRDPDREMMRQIATGVLRVVTALGVLACLPYLVFAVIDTVRVMIGTSYYGNDVEWELAAFFGFLMLVSALVFAFGARLSALIVPARARFEPRDRPRAAGAQRDASPRPGPRPEASDDR
jgi:hypothetical protein